MGTLHQNQQPMETGPLDMPALIRTLPELTFDETMDERADMTCKGSTNSRNSYREVKRRTRAVQVFPSAESMMRPVGPVMAESDEDWSGRHAIASMSLLEKLPAPETEIDAGTAALAEKSALVAME